MKKEKLQTREQKIQFLKNLHNGKASPEDLLQPITAVLFIEQGKVFAYQTAGETTRLNEPVDEKDLNLPYQVTSRLIFEDYSTGTKENR